MDKILERIELGEVKDYQIAEEFKKNNIGISKDLIYKVCKVLKNTQSVVYIPNVNITRFYLEDFKKDITKFKGYNLRDSIAVFKVDVEKEIIEVILEYTRAKVKDGFLYVENSVYNLKEINWDTEYVKEDIEEVRRYIDYDYAKELENRYSREHIKDKWIQLSEAGWGANALYIKDLKDYRLEAYIGEHYFGFLRFKKIKKDGKLKLLHINNCTVYMNESIST